MKLVLHKKENKIRLVIISFSLFVALMLFQTSYMRLGTLTASATLLLTIGTYFLQGKGLQGRLSLNRASVCLLVFLVYSVLLTLLKGMRPSGFVRYIAQIIMCLLLFSVELNQREHNYLKKVFTVAATVYSILIIQAYSANSRAGYYHQDVLIFNTSFDPNMIGIPLVAATNLFLDNILKKQYRKSSIVMYAVNAAAIVYTASRGSTVALLCSNLLLIALFLLKRNLKVGRKALYLVIPVMVAMVLSQILSIIFPTEWARITSIDVGDGTGRLRLWRTALQDWWNSPLLGNGLGYAYYAHQKATHNTYLQVLCETGLIGFMLASFFALPMLKKAFTRDAALFCMLIGILVQIAFLDAVDNRCLWIAMSWIAMLPQGDREEQIHETAFKEAYPKV